MQPLVSCAMSVQVAPQHFASKKGQVWIKPSSPRPCTKSRYLCEAAGCQDHQIWQIQHEHQDQRLTENAQALTAHARQHGKTLPYHKLPLYGGWDALRVTPRMPERDDVMLISRSVRLEAQTAVSAISDPSVRCMRAHNRNVSEACIHKPPACQATL